jgi:hypothetical protein
VADNTADGLTAEHRARIEAVLAPEGRVMTPEAWAELEEFVVCYRIWETRRTTYPIDEERKRWKRLGEAVDTVADELRREKLWASPDPTWRDRALTMLSKVRRKVELRALLHKAWGSPFSRRQNPHRKALYRGFMRVWTDHLGGELAYSKAEKGPPSGPLVRFLVACIEPILGDNTPGGGLGDIIDREREARAATEDFKRLRRERRGV